MLYEVITVPATATVIHREENMGLLDGRVAVAAARYEVQVHAMCVMSNLV